MCVSFPALSNPYHLSGHTCNFTELHWLFNKTQKKINLLFLHCEQCSYMMWQPFSICTVPFCEVGQPIWKKDRHQPFVFWKIFQFFSSSHWRKRQRQVWIIPENWTIGFIWCLQDASPSVGDVGVVGETISGFREILSNSAWTSVKTGFWPTRERCIIQSCLWNSFGKACSIFSSQEGPVKPNKKANQKNYAFA